MPITDYFSFDESPHLVESLNEHAKALRGLANVSKAGYKSVLALICFKRVEIMHELEKAQVPREVALLQGKIEMLDHLHKSLVDIYKERENKDA